mgnify:CR=1 FL=1
MLEIVIDSEAVFAHARDPDSYLLPIENVGPQVYLRR